MKLAGIGAAICLFILGCVGPASADPVDDYVKAEMARQQIPGLCLAIIKDGKPLKVKAFGVTDVDQKTPVSLDTTFQLGSLSKPFTAAAVLMLVERGKIRLDDPVSRFFSNTPAAWRNVTVWHLLTNTSGIKDYLSETPTTAVLDFTADLVYRRAIAAGLNFPPGTQLRYSHTNYVLLGMIIEAATGRPFYEFVADAIFKPLEMTHSEPDGSHKTAAATATGYRMVNGQRSPAEGEKRGLADAFASSSISDLVRWAAALDNGAILSQQAREVMWAPAILTAPPQRKPAQAPESTKPKSAPFGAGWYVESLNGHRVIGHGGSVGGWSSNLSRFPDDHLTVIMLVNLRDAKLFPMIRTVAARYAPALK